MSEQDASAFVGTLAEDAYWSIAYHEHALKKAHVQLAAAIEVFERGGYAAEIDLDALRNESHDDDEDDDNYSTGVELIRQSLLTHFFNVRHHENELKDSHAKVAGAQAVIARGRYDLDLEQIRTAAMTRLRESLEKNDD